VFRGDGVADLWVPEYEYAVPLSIFELLQTTLLTLFIAAIMMEVPETGQRYLSVKHFLTRGVPASIMTFAVVVTVGYGLMSIVGL